MKCLTICQPYPYLILTPQAELPSGVEQKRVENQDEYRRGYDSGKKRNSQDRRVDALRNAYDKKVRQIDEFEKASGIKIDTYGQIPAGIGAAVRHVLEFGKSSLVDCDWLLSQIDEMKETIRSFQAACAIKEEAK